MNKKVAITPTSKPDSDPYVSMEMAVYQEMLHEVRSNHVMHLISIGASLAIVALGGVLWLHEKPMEGAITGSFGTGTSAFYIRLSQMSSRASSRKLDKLLKEVKQHRHSS
jgi:hypothetical protein